MQKTLAEKQQQFGTDPGPVGWQRRLRDRLTNLTLAHLLWGAMFLLASLTRLWDLGSRALHHDESLHTYYSWIFSEGLGYTHHPMMHGPFLFHFNALSYLLFGATDYTSRLTAAVFGIALVMLPWFLRGRSLLGPWGALATSALILISPSLLYYSRFIRHDIFALVGAFLLFIAVVRYLEKPESRWIILAVASVGFVLTTHEITFVNLAILAGFTGTLILYRVVPEAILVILSGVVLFFIARLVLAAFDVGPVPEIPWQEPSTGQVIDYLISLLVHPVIAAAIGIAVLALIAIAWLVERSRDHEKGWIDGTLGTADHGTTADRLATALHDGRAWGIGAIIGGAIFVVLYTSLFSNIGGLGSGTIGAVGYWLGQHDVQRGEQPWFYYLVLAPQYEYLAILGSLAVGIYLVIYMVRYWRGGLETDRRFITLSLAAVWALGMFLVLSWAGEKMPWLIVHFLLPMMILAGAGLGGVIEWIEAQSSESRKMIARIGLLIGLPVALLLVSTFLLLNWASAGPFVDVDDQIARMNREDIPGSFWIVYLPLGLSIVIAIGGILRAGARQTFAVLGGVAAGLLLLLQINAGWNLTYREGDVPRDMLVYVQTSPDLHQTVDDLERLSHELTGGMDLPVIFSGGSQWPLNWYMREFNQRGLFHEVPAEPTSPVVITTTNEIGPEEEERLADYEFIEFPLRWWIPEDRTYRAFAIAPELNTEWRQNVQTDDPPPYSLWDVIRSVGRSVASLRDPEQQGQLFRLVVHRELTAPIGSYSMRIYVHNDYRTYFDGLRYGGPDGSAQS